MASEQFASFINGKKIAAWAAFPGSPLAKQLEGISDGAYRVVTLTDDEHPVPDVENPSHKLLYLTKDEDPSQDPPLLDAYTEWVYHDNEWIIVGSTALNPDNYKLKQDPVSESGTTSQTITAVEQNANGEIDVTYRDILVGTSNIDTGAVTTEKIAPGAVTNEKLGANSVTTDKIADGTIQSGDIGAGQIKTTNIEDAAVTGTKIASETITSANIQDGTIQSGDIGAGQVHDTNIATDAVTESKIHDGAVTTNKIADDAVTHDKVANDAIDTDQLVDDAVTGDKIASETITSDNIQNGTIQSEDIGAGEITETNIGTNAVTEIKIKDGSVTTNKIGDDAVTNDKVADNAIGTNQIINGAVTNDKIGPDAVDGDKIADGAVSHEHIAEDAISEEQIQDDAVTADKVKDGETLHVNIDGNAATATLAADVVPGGELANHLADLDAETERLESTKKDRQTPVADPTVPPSGTTTSLSFIDTISQDDNGVITPTKKNVPTASTEVSGVVRLSNSTTSTSDALAATPLAVKTAKEEAIAQSQSDLSDLDCDDKLSPSGAFNGKYISSLSQQNGLVSYDALPMATDSSVDSNIPVTAHALYSENVSRRQWQMGIEELIPGQASVSNQLADKAYVDAIGERLEARYLSTYDAVKQEFIPFPTHADFVAAQAAYELGEDVFYYNGVPLNINTNKIDNNDIVVITADETHLNEAGGASTTRWRYQCDVPSGDNGHWYFEYVINNTALNKAQLDAINSGITWEKRDRYDNHLASQGQDPNHTNPHHVTFDQLGGRNGVDSTELGVLDGVDTDHIGAAQINTLKDIGEITNDNSTIQYMLDDKMYRITPAVPDDPNYTASNKIAIINDHDVVHGKYGVKDSGAIITDNYTPTDHVNPATGFAIHQAIDALEGTHISDASKMSITVGTAEGIINSVTIDDSGLATAAQGAKADSAVQTVTLNGTELSGNDIDLGSLKTTQSEVTDPTSSGDTQNYEFISNISQNTNGVITATKKLIPDANTDSTKGVVTLAGSIGATVSQENGKAATEKAVRDAINDLNVNNIEGFGAGKTLATLAENNGKISATFQNIAITKSQVTDFSHSHGNITNDGTIGSDTNKILVTTSDGLIVAGDIDGTYSSNNKIATQSTVANAIGELNRSDSVTTDQFVTSVSEANGIITVTKAQPTIGNVDGLSGRLSDIDTAVESLANKKADKVIPAPGVQLDGHLAALDSTGNLADSGYHVVDTYKVSDDKSAYLANPVTGTAVDAAIAESASSDRRYVDEKIADLDAEISSNDGANLQVKVTEVDGKITAVNVLNDTTVNQGDIDSTVATEIGKLDATVATETAGEPAANKNFGISVTETDGVLTGVSIIRDNTINANDLSTAINALDAEETSVDGTNVQFKVTEVDGVVTAVNVTTDNTINRTDLTNAINALDNEVTSDDGKNVQVKVTEENGVVTGVSIDTDNTINSTDLTTAINALDAEEESDDGTNVQFKVTEVDGKITGVSVTTDNTVNSTDVTNAITTAINGLDSNATSIDGTNVQVKVTETDGTISAVNITTDNTVNSTDVSNAITSAIGDLDVPAITGSTSKTITSISETNGLIDATYEDILVGTSNIDTGAVTTEKIAAKAVTTAKIYDKAVTTDKIYDKAVTTDKIADSAVTTGKIDDSAVTTGKIADDAVTNDKIADNAVNTAQLVDDAVTNGKIADSAVDTAQLADDAVTADKVKDGETLPVNISGNASTATTADQAYDIVDGGTLDTRIEGIESNVASLQSGKADKVTGATDGNFAGLDENGNLTDSGVKPSDFKTKQDAVTKTGDVLKTITSLTQNANGEINATFSDIQSATTEHKGVVQLAGSIGATVASENNKAASEKAVRDAIDALDSTASGTGSAELFSVSVAQTNGKVSGVTVDDTALAQELSNVDTTLGQKADKVTGATEGNFAGLDTNGNLTDSGVNANTFKTKQSSKDSPSASGNTLSFIDTVSQDENGEITATKKNVTVDQDYDNDGTNPASGTAITKAIQTLDVSNITANLGVGKTITALSETDGKIAATASDIQISESQVSGLITDLASKENLSNKVASWSETTTDGHYPTEKLVKDSLDLKEDKANKVSSWSATTTDTNYPTEKLVKDTLDTKVPTSRKVNNHALTEDITITKSDVGLGNVANTTITVSALDGVTDSTNNITYKYVHPAGAQSATSAAAVKVGVDALGHAIIGAALTKADVGLGLVENQKITVTDTSVSDGTNTFNKYTHPTTTAVSAAAVKVGKDGLGHVVLGSALDKSDVGLGNVENTSISVSATDGVTDSTNNVTYKYEHPTTSAVAAAAVKVGNDAEGHVVLGAALQKGDVGLGNVDNTSDANKPVSTAQQTALNAKLDKTAGVTAVTWDSTNTKITKTINGTTSDVVTAATLKTAMALNNVTNDAQVKRSEMGVANGVATLDEHGIIPTSQLPSYVDDVIEGYFYNDEFYKDAAHTILINPSSGKVYVDVENNLTYRWGGTQYVKIASALALGETDETAYRGDRGKTAYDHSQVTSGNPHHVTAAEVGLGRVSNTTITVSATDGVTSNDGTTSVTYKYTHPTKTAVAASAKKVGYDNQGHVVLGDALAKGDVGLGNVDNTSDATKKTNFTGSIASGNTGFVTGGAVYTELNKKADKTATVSTVTYDTTNKKITKTINGTTTDVVTAAKLKEDMALDLVKNQAITVTSTSVSDGTNTFNKYTHPTYTAATAAAVKVGRDSTGHVTIGAALGKSDVGLGNVDNTSDATKKTNFTGAVASGNTGFPTGGDVYTAIADNGKGVEIVEPYVTTFEEMSAIVDAGKLPVAYVSSQQLYYPLYSITGSGDNRVYYFANTHVGNVNNPSSDIFYDKYSCQKSSSGTSWSWLPTHTIENVTHKVSSWSSTTTDVHYPTEKLVKDSLDGKASSTHTHGNIQNGGTLQTNDVTIANGDKLVITDSSDNNKVARASLSFDGSTATKALTKRGTFEDFVNQSDIDTAIENIPTISLVGDNHITVTSDDTTGTVTVATDLNSYTAYTAKGSATKVPQITTNALGQVTGITEVEITGVTPAAHTHGNITNDGKIGSTSGYAVYTTTGGALTAGSLAVSSPASSGNTLAFIDTVSQDSKGKITATKKAVTVDSTYDAEGTNPVNGTAIAAAIGTLDVAAITGSASKTITSISETDGKISATYSNISITKSQVSDFAHAHGNIDSKGGITATEVTVASGDSLVIVDSSDTDKKVAKSSIAFDGTTTTTALTPKGTFEAFAKSADITSAINGLDATVTSTDGTNVQVKVTETNGKITAVNVTTDNTASSTHTHGNITNDGKVGSTADLSLVTTTSGAVTTADLTTASPSVPSTGTTTALSFIDTVSQNSKGKISATKKTVPVDSTYNSTGTNPVNGKAIAAALDTLDVSSVGGAGKYISAISETNGKISATATSMDSTPTANSTNAVTSAGILAALNAKTDKSTLGEIVVSGTPGAGKTAVSMENTNGTFTVTVGDISITKSQVSDFSHAHGNIQNGGTLQTSDIAVASGDKLVVTDYSDSAKVARTSIQFDGTTTTKALTPKGTWETFNNYSHPAGSAPSVTGVPTANATPGFGGSFKVNQITTDSTSHVASITERTITLPSLGTTSTTAAKGDHTHTTTLASDSTTGATVVSLLANTQYKITAGGTSVIFKTPVDTTYTSKTAASGGTDVSLVTTGEKWTWNHKQDALTEMTTAEVSALVAAFAS